MKIFKTHFQNNISLKNHLDSPTYPAPATVIFIKIKSFHPKTTMFDISYSNSPTRVESYFPISAFEPGTKVAETFSQVL